MSNVGKRGQMAKNDLVFGAQASNNHQDKS